MDVDLEKFRDDMIDLGGEWNGEQGQAGDGEGDYSRLAARGAVVCVGNWELSIMNELDQERELVCYKRGCPSR